MCVCVCRSLRLSRLGWVCEREAARRGDLLCSGAAIIPHSPALFTLSVSVWCVCVCVCARTSMFKYTGDVWRAAGGGAGFNTLRCLCSLFVFLALHNIMYTSRHPSVVWVGGGYWRTLLRMMRWRGGSFFFFPGVRGVFVCLWGLLENVWAAALVGV